MGGWRDAASRQPMASSAASSGTVELLAGGAALQLDHALGHALGTDDQLPRHADQVGGGELAARPLVGVVVEHRLAGRLQRVDGGFAGRVDTAASPARRLMTTTSNGATASGQMMPASSWLASMIAPSRRETPTP